MDWSLKLIYVTLQGSFLTTSTFKLTNFCLHAYMA